MALTQWLKASRSSANGDCIEVTCTLDRMRDSKDVDGPVLMVDVAALVAAIKSGRFDR